MQGYEKSPPCLTSKWPPKSKSDFQQCRATPERQSLIQTAESHGLQLLTALRSFRERSLMFDFTINVAGHAFPCHRCVLAACSDFFRAMFEVDMRECGDGSVTLDNQSLEAVGAFLDFAYSGEILITDGNIDTLFQLASFLQVPVLSQACTKFLIGRVDLSNCLPLFSIAEAYGSDSLLRSTADFVIQNFCKLCKMQDFLNMQPNVLEMCLQSDILNVPGEEVVVTSLLRWIRHDLPQRQKLLPLLLSSTKLHHLPSLEESEACRALISEAQDRQRLHRGLHTDARPATTQTYIYVHKTEENEDIHHTFCYCLRTNQWKDVGRDLLEAAIMFPDPPGCCFTSYAEKIFVTGGCWGNCCQSIRLHVTESFHDATDEVWCFCPVTLTCTPAPAMLKPRTMHAAVTCLDRVYVIGGRTRGSTEVASSLLEVDCYDPLTETWCSVSPLPGSIFYPEATACGSVIYTLGSEVEFTETFNPLLDCFFCYDAQNDQWNRLVAEFGQDFHATLVKAVSNNNTLHLCDLSASKVFSFCPESCQWKGQGSFECAGFNAGAVCTGDKIYILGGDYSPNEIADDVQVYHTEQNEWEELTPMPKGLTEFHCQLISFNRYRDPWGPARATLKMHQRWKYSAFVMDILFIWLRPSCLVFFYLTGIAALLTRPAAKR